jgi:transposase-like protein
MSRKSRYSTEFKQDAVSRMGQGGKTVTALAEELGVRRKFLHLWRERLRAGGKSALARIIREAPAGGVLAHEFDAKVLSGVL